MAKTQGYSKEGKIVELEEHTTAEVPGTPFMIMKTVKGEKTSYCPILGNVKLSEKDFETEEQAFAYIEFNKWNIIWWMAVNGSNHDKRISKILKNKKK